MTGRLESHTSSSWLDRLRDPATVYEEIGIRPVLHAGGTTTTFGGSKVRDELWAVMRAANEHFVGIEELNRAVGRYIASVTGGESAMVTGGAASGNVLAAAACVIRDDPREAVHLPRIRGKAKPNIVIQRAHRGQFSGLYEISGATLREVGNINTCSEEQIELAMDEDTAAVAVLIASGTRQIGPTLEETVAVAHRYGVPVIVDAAGMLPVKANLRRFIDAGADLVSIGGGKYLRGPQNTGMLFGRADLVDNALRCAAPNMFLGRPFKVGRDQMIALYTALRLYVESDEPSEIEVLRRRLDPIIGALEEVPGTSLQVVCDGQDYMVPTLIITLDDRFPDTKQLHQLLLDGEPRFFSYHDRQRRHLIINPTSLHDEAELAAAARLKEVLGGF